MTAILGYVGDFVDQLISTGGDIITFITAQGHEICLVPIIMLICVFFVSSIRKMIKGV